jgi:ElaB/YqjD/DUF883 family membrane-anchored ribosome-binding protein
MVVVKMLLDKWNQNAKGTNMETHFENMEHAHSNLARERVVADLKSLVRDSEDLLRATAGDVSEKAKEVRSRIAGALERAKVTCKELQDQTTANATAAARKADEMIREHPYESLGVAFGLGLLLGALVTRK